MKRKLLARALTLFIPFSADALAMTSAEDVAAISDIWAQGRYLAPDIACDPRSWDAAFVESAARLSAGTMTREEAGRTLFSASPAYFRPAFQNPYSAAAVQERQGANELTVHKGVYVLRINGALTKDEIRILSSRSRRSTLVLDLRSAPNEGIWDIVIRSAVFENPQALEALGLPMSLPSIQSVSYRGYPTEFGYSSGYFRSSLVDSVTDQETAIARPSKNKGETIVLLGNRSTVLPRALMAARLAGQAHFVSVDGQFSYGGLPTWEINENDGRAAMLLGRFKGFSLARALTPDEVISEACAGDQKCIEKTARSRSRAALPSFRDKQECSALPAPDPTFGGSGNYPPLGGRLYAAAKLYHVLRLFHPLPSALGARLRERYLHTLEAVAAAQDERSYALALGRFLAPMSDGHIEIASMSYFEGIGLGGLPVRTLSTGEKVYIGCEHPGAPGLKTGDQVLGVDGRDMPGLLREIKKDVMDTPASEVFSNASRYIFRGPVDSTLTVAVRGQDGRDKTIRLTRSAVSGDRCMLPWAPRPDIEMLWLRPDVAYLNLSAIGPSRMEEIIPELSGAKFIIVDDRGAAQGGAWPLGAHVGAQANLRVARFVTPMVLGREAGNNEYSDATAAVTRFQTIKAGLEPRIRAKLFILIDENTASQAEHSIHLLKAAANAVTVGSLTRGAGGDVTYMTLPGNIRVAFSGQAVSDLDGHETLGVGITPDYVVKPTVQDAILGIDRVLNTAIELIDKMRAN